MGAIFFLYIIVQLYSIICFTVSEQINVLLFLYSEVIMMIMMTVQNSFRPSCD